MLIVYGLEGTLIVNGELTPLANKFFRHVMTGENVVTCTSGVMTDADYEFLKEKGLHVVPCLSRQPENRNQSNADLREDLLDSYLEVYHEKCLDNERVVMYESDMETIERLRGRGVLCSVES